MLWVILPWNDVSNAGKTSTWPWKRSPSGHHSQPGGSLIGGMSNHPDNRNLILYLKHKNSRLSSDKHVVSPTNQCRSIKTNEPNVDRHFLDRLTITLYQRWRWTRLGYPQRIPTTPRMTWTERNRRIRGAATGQICSGHDLSQLLTPRVSDPFCLTYMSSHQNLIRRPHTFHTGSTRARLVGAYLPCCAYHGDVPNVVCPPYITVGFGCLSQAAPPTTVHFSLDRHLPAFYYFAPEQEAPLSSLTLECWEVQSPQTDADGLLGVRYPYRLVYYPYKCGNLDRGMSALSNLGRPDSCGTDVTLLVSLVHWQTLFWRLNLQ